jgi:CelD/BcsL family acetyltransferase involved in cellulose biosynthesis
MAEVINLNDRLNRFAKNREAVQQQRQAQAVAAAHTTATAKAAAWQRIQTEAPGLAELMSAVTATFGKPRRVTVTLNGERVL